MTLQAVVCGYTRRIRTEILPLIVESRYRKTRSRQLDSAAWLVIRPSTDPSSNLYNLYTATHHTIRKYSYIYSQTNLSKVYHILYTHHDDSTIPQNSHSLPTRLAPLRPHSHQTPTSLVVNHPLHWARRQLVHLEEGLRGLIEQWPIAVFPRVRAAQRGRQTGGVHLLF